MGERVEGADSYWEPLHILGTMTRFEGVFGSRVHIVIGCCNHKLEFFMEFYRYEEVLQASNLGFLVRKDFFR